MDKKFRQITSLRISRFKREKMLRNVLSRTKKVRDLRDQTDHHPFVKLNVALSFLKGQKTYDKEK